MKEKFLSYYQEVKKQIDQKLEEYNKSLDEENPILKKNFNYFKNLNSDGKCIRGTLVNLGYYLLKEDKDYSLNLAVAYEIFQTAILVHDDIIDNDEKRRGKDTIHYANYKNYEQYGQKDNKHFSNSLAICMGDYGLYEANKMIAKCYQNDKNLGKILQVFDDTVLTTIKGELLDVILPFEGKIGKIDQDKIEEYIMEVYRKKTSHYTIIGPMSVGILLAGGDEQKQKDLEKFGEKVGIAFQIQDDILGIFSSEMGKVKGSDIKEFKQTILYSHILNTSYKDEFLKYYGNESLDETTIKKVQQLLTVSNSLEYATNKMNSFYDSALEDLEEISWLNEEKKDLLRGFVEYLRNRKK